MSPHRQFPFSDLNTSKVVGKTRQKIILVGVFG
jgi:hypothetical protein